MPQKPLSDFFASFHFSRTFHGCVRGGCALLISLIILIGLNERGLLFLKSGVMQNLSDRLAHSLGFSAQQVRISGLERHKPEEVLKAIGVRLGGSLIGFDAPQARWILENVDWISRANVRRIYPNQLEIALIERKPLAIWQRGGRYFVIDQAGDIISTLDDDPEGRGQKRLLVTGEGAPGVAASLIAQLDKHPLLKTWVSAVAWVGQRRWTLYVTTGQRIELPEEGVEGALALLESLEKTYALSKKALADIDLRIEGHVFLRPVSNK